MAKASASISTSCQAPSYNKLLKIIDKASQYDWSAFADLIQVTCYQFLMDGTEDQNNFVRNAAKRYTPEIINEFVRTLLFVQKEIAMVGAEVNDVLGDIYMDIAGRSKQSMYGQFFTPWHVCQFMAQITVGEEKNFTVCDPCSGSGRTLLAAYEQSGFTAICYANDLDRVCTYMTLYNFLIHGITGQVTNGDGLANTMNYGFNVLRMPNGMPYCTNMRQDELVIFHDKLQKIEQKPVAVDLPGKQQPGLQMSLF